MAKVLDLNINEFKMMKSGIKYEEIRDLSHTIFECGLFKSSKVFIELGRPSNPGLLKVMIYEATIYQEEDNELFQYSDLLFEISVNKDSTVSELKSQIAKEYSAQIRKQDDGEDFHKDQIRIRDKGFDRLGKIFREGKYVKEYGI